MERTKSGDLLRTKRAEALAVRQLTPRDIHVPGIPGKDLAVNGVRRGGKASFLQRRMAERLDAGSTSTKYSW
jgi:hypothetical protein